MNRSTSNQPVCVVTGGSSGIGQATVRLFAEKGYQIASCGRNTTRLQALRDELSTHGTSHLVEQLSLDQIPQTKLFGEKILQQFEQVDVLINNAACAPLSAFDEISTETFEETLNLNIRSPFYLTQMMWQQMRKQGSGVVVNISSLAAVDPFPGFSIYGASKAWLDLITTALRSEGQEYGIRTYSIRAGAVETPMLRTAFPDFPSDQCVAPEAIADAIWACVNNEHESGTHLVVENQD